MKRATIILLCAFVLSLKLAQTVYSAEPQQAAETAYSVNAPTDLRVEVLENGYYHKLTWIDHSGGDASFTIEWATDSGQRPMEGVRVGPGITSFTFGDPPNRMWCGTTYSYWVTAYSAADNTTSLPSNVVSARSSDCQILLNPSFETPGSNWRRPESWDASWNSGRTWRTCAAGVSHEGACSVRIWTSGDYAQIYQVINLPGHLNDSMVLGFWYRGSNLTTTRFLRARVSIYWTDGRVQLDTFNFPMGTYGWRYTQMAFLAYGDYTRITIAFQSNGTHGTAWVDQVQLLRNQ